MKSPTLLTHIRDIIILPFTVTCIIPYFIYNSEQKTMLDNLPAKVGGIFFLLFGIALFLYAVYLFKTIGKGTIAPWTPTQKLIIVGPYQYCRNPMITGVLSILVGEGLLLHSTNILWWAVAFFFINTLYFIVFEEPTLTSRFGEDYRQYKKHVPRWIPRINAYKQDQ